MNILKSILAVSLFLFVLSALPTPEISVDATYFDHFIYTQFWAPGSCMDFKKTCKFSKLPPMWTIHGLWPTLGNTKGPEKCTNVSFNQKLLTDKMLDFMDKYWYTYITNRTNSSFWEHEWDHHGTCAVAGDTKKIPDQKSYFQNTIDLYNTYNISLILSKANILPGMTKSYAEFQNAFKNVLGHKVGLMCRSTNLTALEICFDKELSKVIDCDGIYGCSQSKPIDFVIYD